MRRGATLAFVVAIGCSGTAAPPERSAGPAPSAWPASLQAKLAAHDRVRDPGGWALFVEQHPPTGYREIHRAARSFAIGEYDEVRAYYHGFDAWGSVDDVVGCHGWAVAPDGTLCPSVVLPGVDVGTARGRALAALFDAPRPATPQVVTCAAYPQLSFVYTRGGTPVGEIAVDLRCPRWEAAPGVEETFPSHTTREAFARLCKDAGLPLCGFNDAEEQRAEELWRAGNEQRIDLPVTDARRRPRPLPVAGSAVLSRLTERERLQLCVWNSEHVRSALAPGRDHGGMVFPGSAMAKTGGALAWPACIQHFPSCPRTVAEVAPCQDRAQRGDPWLALPGSASCVPLRACIWGFETSEMKP